MSASDTTQGEPEDGARRDFIHLLAVGVTGVGAAGALWPFVDQLNPDASVKALATKEVDLSAVEVGQAIKVLWRGKPVFIRRRTEREIEEAAATAVASLPDPQTDEDRVKDVEGVARPEWLVVIGVCTHLGCIPQGTASGETKGEYNGWFCPCHGSHYDTSGRIRKGPAPSNLEVPAYTFLNDTTIRIG